MPPQTLAGIAKLAPVRRRPALRWHGALGASSVGYYAFGLIWLQNIHSD
jgi:hypothetical protein